MKAALSITRRQLHQTACSILVGGAWLRWIDQTFAAGVSQTLSTDSGVSQLGQLDRQQSAVFRHWFMAIVKDQVDRQVSPRWTQRDCAGLVRFGVREALKSHDSAWLKSMGWRWNQSRAPDVVASETQKQLWSKWTLPNGSRQDFAPAIAIVQGNARWLGRDRTQALPGDLLFFDQGDDQHLMIWTGQRILYHNGSDPTPHDNGLRALTWQQLESWPDTRWRPDPHNSNYAGLFRLAFLSD